MCVFVHSCFVENPPIGSWETNPCFFRGVLSHDTTHFITNCPKMKKLDSSNKYDCANQNDYNNKGDNKKKNRFGDNNKKKKFQKIMS
jgi:hypothetical protein